MVGVRERYAQLQSTYEHFDYRANTYVCLHTFSLKHPDQQQERENELILSRDALIYRFKFSIELTWKFLQFILEEQWKLEITSPRAAVQEARIQKIINEEEVRLLLELLSFRNRASHIYSEELIDFIAQEIVTKYPPLQAIIKRIDSFI